MVRKYESQCRTTAISLLCGFGLGLLLCWFLYLSAPYCLYFALCGLLGGAVACHHGQQPIHLVLALGVAALLALFGILLSHWSAVPVAGITIYLLCFGGATMGGYAFYPPLGIFATLALLAAIPAASVFSSIWQNSALLLAILALLLTMDGLRANSLRQGQMKHRDEAGVAPADLTEHSLWIYLRFLGVAALISLVVLAVGFLFWQVLKQLWGLFNYWLLQDNAGIFARLRAFLLWLIYLFQSLFHGQEDPGEGFGMEPHDDGWTLLPYVASSAFTTLLVAASVLCAAALTTGLIVGISRRNLTRDAETDAAGDYVDEIEFLERPKRKRRFRSNRPQRFSDFTDDRLKIRFAFQQLLRHRMEQNPSAYTCTPNELKNEELPDEATLIDAYNRVRYGNGTATPEEVSAAGRYVESLHHNRKGA